MVRAAVCSATYRSSSATGIRTERPKRTTGMAPERSKGYSAVREMPSDWAASSIRRVSRGMVGSERDRIGSLRPAEHFERGAQHLVIVICVRCGGVSIYGLGIA